MLWCRGELGEWRQILRKAWAYPAVDWAGSSLNDTTLGLDPRVVSGSTSPRAPLKILNTGKAPIMQGQAGIRRSGVAVASWYFHHFFILHVIPRTTNLSKVTLQNTLTSTSYPPSIELELRQLLLAQPLFWKFR